MESCPPSLLPVFLPSLLGLALECAILFYGSATSFASSNIPLSTFLRFGYRDADPLSIFSEVGPTWSVPVAADPMHSPLCLIMNLGIGFVITIGLFRKIFYDDELTASREFLCSFAAKWR